MISNKSQTHVSDMEKQYEMPEWTDGQRQRPTLRERRKVVTLTLLTCGNQGLRQAPSGPMTTAVPTQTHKIETLSLPPPLLSLAKTVRQSSCPLFLTFHRTCFTVRVKWPSKLRGGTGRRGVGRLF